jgi:hypothetical protein
MMSIGFFEKTTCPLLQELAFQETFFHQSLLAIASILAAKTVGSIS